MLPEQPIKEQNRSFELLFVAADSLAGEGVALAGGGVVIFNNEIRVLQFINYQHVSFFYFGHHTNRRGCASRAIPTKPT